jgi:hypothetical protein
MTASPSSISFIQRIMLPPLPYRGNTSVVASRGRDGRHIHE